MKRLLFIFLAVFSLSSAAVGKEDQEIAALRAEADSLHSIGKSDSAIIVGEKALRLAEKSGNKVEVLGALTGQGVYLRSVGRIEEALSNYNAAMEIVTTEDFLSNPDADAVEEITTLYINVAVLDLDMQHKAEATANAIKAGDWCARSDNPEFKAMVFGVVGSVLTGCGDLKRAVEYQKLAYRNAMESNDTEAAFRAAAYSMLISDRNDDKREAAKWREECNMLLPRVKSLMARLVYYQAECSLCLKSDDRRGAIEWFDRIVSQDGIDNLPFIKFDAYNNMHIAYAGLGDYENAYKTLLKGNELRDTIWEREKAESLRDLSVKYQTKEAEVALAQSEAKRARILMWLFIAIGFILISVTFFILYATRQRRKRMQKEIEYAKLQAEIGHELTRQYVEGLENERSRMARELHDGVCNDLLAVEQSLHNGKTTKEAEKMIAGCRESVRRISHELLPPEFTYASIDEVIRYFVGKQAKANEDKIKLEYRAENDGDGWNGISDEVALEIYRIVQEAVGNAVKHSGGDRITVTLRRKNGELILRIADNGKFSTPERPGVGIGSIKKRAHSIGGEVRVGGSEKGGSEVVLTVKTQYEIKNYGKP